MEQTVSTDFFSLVFPSFFYFFLEQTVFAHSFSLVLLYLDLNVIVELKLNVEINFFSNYYLEHMEFPTNFWNSVLPVSYCGCSIDQKNVVWCNSVIEELSFH